jgi:hypothetical protein
VVTIVLWKAPIGWSFRKIPLEISQEVRDSVDEIFESLRRASTSFSIVDPLMFPIIPEPQVVKTLSLETCPTCGLVLSEDDLSDHLSTSGHGKPKDSPTFAVKIGSPYDLEDNTPGAGVYRLVLKSSDKLPSWAESERPIRIDVEGETLVYWIRWDGLRRIK